MKFRVSEEDTAKKIQSGDLDVLATPALLAKMEYLAKESAFEEILEGETTVGVEINMKHLRPSAVGTEYDIFVDAQTRAKNIITYVLTATQNGEVIGKAIHKRAIVNIEKFMNKLS